MTAPDETAVDAGSLVRIATGYRSAQALMAAVEIGLFTVLSAGRLVEPAVRERFDLRPGVTADFLDALVALGVLERSDDGEYSNAPVADRHLVAGRDEYLGGMVAFHRNHLYRMWHDLPSRLRAAAARPEPGSVSVFEEFYADPARLRRFLAAMDAATAHIGPALAAAFPWSRYATFADLGGAAGTLSTALVRAHPHLTGVCLDLPPVQPVFDEIVAREGLSDRLAFRAADFFCDRLPAADVVVLGHVLHDWSVSARRVLLDRVFDALPDGGVVLVYDAMIADDRSGPSFPLLSSVNIGMATGGSEYTVGECSAWLAETGFDVGASGPLSGTDTYLVGCKG